MRLRRKGKKILFISLGVVLVAAVSIFLIFKFDVFSNKENIDKPHEETPKPEVKKLKIVNEDSKTRPYAVMINNLNQARKYQAGLQDAYIIYEMIVEGGITRYMALFKDMPTTKIGTVRSARHYYLDYALENDAYYVHWGWSDQAKYDIQALKINNINGLIYGGTYFWKDRTLNIGTEHTAYTNIEKLSAAVDKLGFRKETNKDLLLNYSVDEINMSEIKNATLANSVTINYSRSYVTSYLYDEVTKTYLRSVNGVAHTDYDTKLQYHFKNIITYKLENNGIAGDNKGRQDIENIGTGNGFFISNGYSIPITWKKESRSEQTKYYYEDGSELKVNDGNTFIQIEPNNQELIIA
ncbi:MAG: DUF3048 domain-containing protein [Bacilli bacterium]